MHSQMELQGVLSTQSHRGSASQPQGSTALSPRNKTIEARTVHCYPQKLHQDRCWTGEHFRPIIRGLANMKKTVQRFHLRAGTVE
ncbi:hypothetical protein G5714_019514 [Onychostoma macrolepis]|uniref:Uncharacterized protein n=1 Tax=Onychostoma macrolepis TaxID=369639 RepID=A0A7J6BWN6_9TELE|nr:hypothetical protein G5714_019514 [Onychostoma macrolepis]